MNYIGNIIREYRDMQGMSRKELAENICSEKYVYLIENGTRTPSAEVSRSFGEKLGVDLFKYYEYLDCIDPIQVEATISLFYKYRSENNMDDLLKETDLAMQLPDFQRKPWIYEIEHNKIAYKVLKEGKCLEAIDEIQNILKKAERKYKESICFAGYYVLLSTCYQMIRDLDQAKAGVQKAMELIANKENISKDNYIVIAVKINKITLHFAQGEYDDVIREGFALNQYQIKTSSYELGHHGLFYLAYAHYQKGLEEEGIEWFLKALYASLIRTKPSDIFYLTQHKIFNIMISDGRVPRDLAGQFMHKYNIVVHS